MLMATGKGDGKRAVIVGFNTDDLENLKTGTPVCVEIGNFIIGVNVRLVIVGAPDQNMLEQVFELGVEQPRGTDFTIKEITNEQS